MHIEQQGLILNIKVKPATALHKKNPKSDTFEYPDSINKFYGVTRIWFCSEWILSKGAKQTLAFLYRINVM